MKWRGIDEAFADIEEKDEADWDRYEQRTSPAYVREDHHPPKDQMTDTERQRYREGQW